MLIDTLSMLYFTYKLNISVLKLIRRADDTIEMSTYT